MDVAEVRLRQVLEGVKQYRVPLYQRPYAWKARQLERLWNDLSELAVGRTVDPKAVHFTGSLVLSLGTVSAAGTEFLVVDGQQRLTTLSILLAAFRDHIADDEPDADQHRAELDENYIVNRFKRDDGRLKLLPTQADREAYLAVVNGTASSSHDPSGVLTAYRYFRTRIAAADDPNDPDDVRSLEEAALDGLAFVSITAKDENVYRIFESLNNTGLKLTQGDLLRNYVFMRLGEAGEEVYSTSWLPMQRTLSSDDLEALFWYDLLFRDPDVKSGDTFDRQQVRMSALNVAEVRQEVEVLSSRARLLAAVRAPLTTDASDLPDRIRDQLERLRIWGTATADPVILFLLMEHAAGRADEDELSRALHVLESYLVRRLVIAAPPNGLARILFRASYEIRGSAESVDTALLRYLSTGRKFFATDAQIADAVLNAAFYYSGKPSQKKQLLVWLEQTFGSKEQVDLGPATIEHVLPQTLTTEWRWELAAGLPDDVDPDVLHEQRVHTLANLTLTGYNSELSNKPFAVKRAALATSGIRMNQGIAAEETWNSAALDARAADLTKRIVTHWASPLAQDLVVDAGVSWASIDQLVAAIPPGRWTSYGEIAAAVGSHAIAVGRYLGTTAPENAWRVLNVNGVVAPDFHWPVGSPFIGRIPREVLAEEGVVFDDKLRAAPAQKLVAGELVQMIGGAALPDSSQFLDSDVEESAFAEQLAEANPAATVHGVLQVLHEWGSSGGDFAYGRGQEVSCSLMMARTGEAASIWPLALYPRHSSAEVVFQWLRDRPPFDDRALREELRQRLNAVEGISIGADRLDSRPSFALDLLADQGRRARVLDALKWFQTEVQAADAREAR